MSGWKRDGTGIKPGGDVGGDVQATESYSVRYHHTRRPGALVTVSVFGAYVLGETGAYRVTTMTEYMVCEDPRDPGGTERWADVTYVTGPKKYSAQNIDRAARLTAERHRPGPDPVGRPGALGAGPVSRGSAGLPYPAGRAPFLAQRTRSDAAYTMAYICQADGCGKPGLAHSGDPYGLYTGACSNGHLSTVMAS